MGDNIPPSGAKQKLCKINAAMYFSEQWADVTKDNNV
jgi:hypothetical protein